MMFTYPGRSKPQDILDKDELIVGKEYRGHCRNADRAVWTGKNFEYERSKFGDVYKDHVVHPADDCGFDVFMPLRSLNEGL